ncbi:hypothetical protein N7494_009402 [Penicillium frequentans]|uniref:Peptidase S8/S53 domain-containing protein n=1 Tax=Penicillium frequentans TaxID=3151616 RepID=A0AAD6GBJ0_9EURO|nr:hypothetical protein N7494_009402 [Penicillium glabrum]
MIASQGMTLWQEISLSISLQIQDKYSGIDYSIDEFSDSDSDDEASDCKELVQLKRGDVCQLLDENNYNRIHFLLDGSYRLHKRPDPECLQYFTLPGCGHSLAYILCYGNLSIEHRILLAYTLARACWQFYNFDIVHEKWTSDNIFFMPTDNQDVNQIPLRAFLSIPFDQVSRSPDEFLETGAYTHRYPRILFLGIMLLEIGLGESLGLGSLGTSKLSSVAYINRAHAKARMRLNEFKKIPWDGFSYKSVFVEAIENCLDSQNFKDTYKPQRKRAKGKASERRPMEDMPALQQRRTALYRKVVAPLCWLAEVGFESSGEVPLITVKKSQRQKPTFVDDEEIRTFWDKVRAPTFDTNGPSARSGAWMNHLGVISGHVLRCCFTDWKDFADASQIPVDAFGHGTFMARLLLQIAPIVDLSVVRVAVTQDQLSSNEESVVQAIEYAGLDWKADIISMSFNFPRSSTPISDVIDKVVKKREKKIIFLASAGNSSSDRGEGFPARHPYVIPIYATDYQGTFLRSNPTRSGDGPRVLGTYGDNLPDFILEEMKIHFPGGDFSPGTSVATAIAAGIVAMMLSYSAALPVLVQAKLFEETLENLKTPKGMTSLLRVMSQNTDYRGDSVNPVRFWSDKSKDKEVFLAICKALAE